MTDKLPLIKNDFLRNNARWVIGLIFAIIMLWLNSRYETKEEAAIHDTNFDKLEEEFGLYKQKLETLEGRFEKKLKIINKNTKEIDDNENNIIRLQEKK